MNKRRKYKVKLYGARTPWSQIDRLEEGFKGLGHIITSGDDYDFVYCNNFDYTLKDEKHKDSAFYEGGSQLPKKGFKIFNVLDIPPYVKDFPIEKLKEQLITANAITCISPPVQEQVKFLGFDSDVIWNPIKDVFRDKNYDKSERVVDCLYVGRASDPNKRFLFLKSIISRCTLVGPQEVLLKNDEGLTNKYLGLVDDLSLNNLYNCSKILAFPSIFEGLGLPPLEAMVCGAIPLVCSDNPNSKLCPDFCVCEPTEESFISRYSSLINHFDYYHNIIVEEYSSQIQNKFSKFSIAQNIIDVFEKYN
mgnify:FL=1|tara:strand:+ start:360 stop:1277 length:918 start_codon:yes stop_codon:yes gene_type:complete